MTDNTTTEVRKKIVAYTTNHPELTISAIATKLDVPYGTLTKLLLDAGYHRRQYRKLASFDLGKLEG